MAKVNKNIEKRSPLDHALRDGQLTVEMTLSSGDFIRKNKLWIGLNNYRWLSKFLVAIGVCVGILFFRKMGNFFDSSSINQLSFDQSATGVLESLIGTGQTIATIGSYKYIILFLIEVLVFHFVRVTLMNVTGAHIDTSFKTFLNTQKRMVVVTIFCLVLENVVSFVLNIPFNIFGADFFSPAIFVLVAGYYTGFVIQDNYNEVYHMTLRQSNAYNWQYAIVTLIVGLIVSGLMLIPFVGAIAGPIIGAVIATRTMHQLYLNDNDRDWVYARYPDRAQQRNVRKSS